MDEQEINQNEEEVEKNNDEETEVESSGPSNLTIAFLYFLAALSDLADILESFVTLTLLLEIILFILFFIIKSAFYIGIFITGLLPKYIKSKQSAIKLIMWVSTIAAEYIPFIEMIPFKVITFTLLILEVKPEFFETLLKFLGEISKIASKLLKFIPTPQTQIISRSLEKVQTITKEAEGALKLIRKAEVGKTISTLTKEMPTNIQPRLKMPRATKIIVLLLISSLPLLTFAQDYYSEMLRQLEQYTQPSPQPSKPSIQSPTPSQSITTPVQQSTDQTTDNIVYISVRKVPNGLLIGLEPNITEKGVLLNSDNFKYEVNIPEISSQRYQSSRNIIFIKSFDLPTDLTINAVLTSLKSQEKYQFRKFIKLPKPEVVIASIDPAYSLIKPYTPDSRFLIALPFYFTSDNLQYRWLFDNREVSRLPTIEKPDNVKRIEIQVVNFYNPDEKASFSLTP